LHRILPAFRDLLDLVANDHELVEFAPAARELYRQVRVLHRGGREIPKFSKDGPIRIKPNVPALPNAGAASRLLAKIERLPGPFPGVDEPEFVRAYARVLRNMVVSMMSAIFAQYPEIIPGRAHGGG
jgi:hypothetical protein